ncbi:hypothetical protein K435DRAFT_705252, partial [Dendrothele bispora CBS 962.96]
FIISDILVVWRAWILFPQNTLVQLFLFLCTLGTCGAIIQELIIDYVLVETLDDPYWVEVSHAIYTALPLFTNIVATLLIGYKTWSLFRSFYLDIKKNLGSTHGNGSKALKLLVFLAESGLIYCSIWVR